MKIIDNLNKDNRYEHPKMFVSDDKKIRIIILPYNYNKPTIFISHNNEIFKAVHSTGMSQSGLKKNLSFTFEGRNHKLFILENKGFLGDNILINHHFMFKKQIGNELHEEYIPYDNPRIIESGYIMDNIEIYVTRPQYDWTYDDFIIYKIKKLDHSNGFMHEALPCSRVDRYRDGGTTYYHTDQGILYSPTPWDKELSPNWDLYGRQTQLEKIEFPYKKIDKKLLSLLKIDEPE